MSNKPSIIALTRTVTKPYLSKYARAISMSSASGGRSRIFQTKYSEENTPRKISGSAIVFQMFLDTCVMKKFSSPKIKMWFEPMFFYGFFCGFQRCGSAAFPNFRGGIFSEKCVRTNSRILHQTGKVKEFWLASLRSAANSYSILGVKTNSRFRILGEENFLILNPKTI